LGTLRLEDVTKVYETAEGPVVALDRLDLTALAGLTTVILGPSGCGKSTLLRVAAGLEGDFTGHVYYDGQDVEGVDPGERDVGIVFQSYALYPHFTGQEHLGFPFLVRRTPAPEAKERIRRTSEVMGYGFETLLKRKPGTLSGGEQQRHAVARALVRQPRFLFLDEPLANLDAKLRTRTRVELKRLLQEFRITTLYVTHNQEEAIALAHRIAVMRAGRVEQVGSYRELRRNPANAFVAGFVGLLPMNLLPGVVAGGRLCLGRLAVSLPEDVAARVREGEGLLLGAYPEDLGVVPEGEGDLTGVVEVIEPDYSRREQVLHVRAEVGAFAVVIPLERHVELGYEVEVVFPGESLYFFDAERGRRLGRRE
jgi:ABC-type sugar transport system ATPase subunit